MSILSFLFLVFISIGFWYWWTYIVSLLLDLYKHQKWAIVKVEVEVHVVCLWMLIYNNIGYVFVINTINSCRNCSLLKLWKNNECLKYKLLKYLIHVLRQTNWFKTICTDRQILWVGIFQYIHDTKPKDYSRKLLCIRLKVLSYVFSRKEVHQQSQMCVL